jgi:hypothetical protein
MRAKDVEEVTLDLQAWSGFLDAAPALAALWKLPWLTVGRLDGVG